MAQNTDYSKRVKIALIERDWTYTDLAAKVSDKTGMFCDSAYISRILSGERNSQPISAAINEILGLPPEIDENGNGDAV